MWIALEKWTTFWRLPPFPLLTWFSLSSPSRAFDSSRKFTNCWWTSIMNANLWALIWGNIRSKRKILLPLSSFAFWLCKYLLKFSLGWWSTHFNGKSSGTWMFFQRLCVVSDTCSTFFLCNQFNRELTFWIMNWQSLSATLAILLVM